MVQVSIIIPIYNKEKYLSECLRSILGQSFRNIEVLCINDGSIDHSLSILKHYAAVDQRIKIINQKNAGAGAARNRGIDQSAGEFVLFMDADDYYPSLDIVEKLYQTAKRENAVICGGSFSECREDGSVRTAWTGRLKDYKFNVDGFISYAEYQFDYGFHRFLYSKQFLKSEHIRYPDYAWYEDPPFMVQAMRKAGKFYAMQKITYCYRWKYQRLKWNRQKVNDLVRGISDNMQAACESGLSKLLFLNYKRMTEDYFDIIRSNMTRDNLELISLLIQANRIINVDLLMQQIPDFDPEVQQMPLYNFFIKESLWNPTLWVARSEKELRSIVGKLCHSRLYMPVRTLLRKYRDVRH